MQKQKLMTLAFVVAAATLFATSFRSTAQERKVPHHVPLVQCSIIDELDEHIQQRFLKADRTFGYLRVAPRTHVATFQPNNEDEWATVNDLQKSGWQVGFYLAGRAVLGEKPAAERWQVKSIYHPLPPIKGGLPITNNVELAALPPAHTLWEQARNAMQALREQDQAEFTNGAWTFKARPIRAQAECLTCHVNDNTTRGSLLNVLSGAEQPPSQTIQVGDVLGVALYAYKLKK